MSPGSRSSVDWWRKLPTRPRWIYVACSVIAAAAVLGVLYLAPVPHSASANYLVVIPIPTNSTTSSCRSTVFYQAGIFDFYWYVPNGNPTTLKVQNPEDSIVYNGLTWGGQSASFKVDSAGIYTFCLGINAIAPTGAVPVVTVNGNVTYEKIGPLL